LSKLIDIPSNEEIRNIIDHYDHRWFLSDSPTYVFDYGLVESQRLSPLSFNIKLRTYEVSDIELSDLLKPEMILVYGYLLEFVMLYNDVGDKWNIDSLIKNQELSGLNIRTLPNSEDITKNLINRVGDDLIDQFEPEELIKIDLNKIHSSLHELLSDRSS
jgi:hypothetical protein